jgi:hypothetical protein
MLSHPRKPADTALHLRDELGSSAFSFASSRVEEARQASDQLGVRHWNDVAHELLALDRLPEQGGRRPQQRSFWRLMQRVEYYRHKATLAEQKAAAAPDSCRQDMLELARQWRDLALHADLHTLVSASQDRE